MVEKDLTRFATIRIHRREISHVLNSRVELYSSKFLYNYDDGVCLVAYQEKKYKNHASALNTVIGQLPPPPGFLPRLHTPSHLPQSTYSHKQHNSLGPIPPVIYPTVTGQLPPGHLPPVFWVRVRVRVRVRIKVTVNARVGVPGGYMTGCM